LLYGQQLSRIAGMTRHQLRDAGAAVSTVRHTDLELAEPLISFVRARLAAPRRHDSLGAPHETSWLFPVTLPGRPITAARLGQRLGELGIDAQAGRRAALRQLAIEVPAAVLANLLGIAITTATDCARTPQVETGPNTPQRPPEHINHSPTTRPGRGDDRLDIDHSSSSNSAVTSFNRGMSLDAIAALLGHYAGDRSQVIIARFGIDGPRSRETD
jgi:hypothetical protein